MSEQDAIDCSDAKQNFMIGDKHDEMEGLQFHCYIDIAIHRASNAFTGALNDGRHMKRKKNIRRRMSDQRFRIWIRLILLAKTLDEAPSVSPNFAQMSYLTHSNLDLHMYAVGVSVPSLCSERRHLRGYCTTATGTFVFRDVDVDIDNRPLSMAGKTTARHHDHGNTVSYTQGVLSECATYLANRNIAI